MLLRAVTHSYILQKVLDHLDHIFMSKYWIKAITSLNQYIQNTLKLEIRWNNISEPNIIKTPPGSYVS